MIWIFLLIFLCIFSFAVGWYTLGWIMVAFFVVIGIAVASANDNDKKKAEIRKKEEEEKKKQEAIELEKKKTEYNFNLNDVIAKYGQPDKIITIEQYDINKEIIAFGNSKRIWIMGKDMPMSDILSCTINDNSHIEKGAASYETKTKTGNMAKRAIVGGVLTGGAGAVIGGATAKKEIVVNQENDKLIHDYTVIQTQKTYD